jgi:hypothetical protein
MGIEGIEGINAVDGFVHMIVAGVPVGVHFGNLADRC